MKKLLLLVTLVFASIVQSNAQTLAEELFNYNGGNADGASGGFGWENAWIGQGPIGGYIINTTPFSYPGFTITNYYSNNLDYTPFGRRLELNKLGNNFEPNITTVSSVAECGTNPAPCKMVGKGTIYLGFLLRKATNADDATFINLNIGDENSPYGALVQTNNNHTAKISFGYYGTSFAGIGNNAGNRYFGIATHTVGGINQFNINYTKPLTVGVSNFLVLRIQYGAVTTISGFINPPIATFEPTTPDILITTTGFMGFSSFSWANYVGGGTGEIDEIRFGARYQDVYATNQCSGAATTSFYYGAGTVCKNSGTIYPNFIGSVPGTFFSTASGILNLNPSSGIITVGPTLSGIYMINYSIPGSGICRDVTINYALEVTATPNTIFDKTNSVTGSIVCQNDNGSITIKDSQIGIGYELIKSGTPATFTGIKLNAATAGDDVVFDIPSSLLGVGMNTFSISGTIKTGIDSTAGRPKRGAVALRASTPIVLDGIMTEPGWNFRNILTKKVNQDNNPLFNTSYNDIRFGTIWDNNYLYVGVQYLDPTFTITGDDMELYLYGNSSITREYAIGGFTGDTPPDRFNTATQFKLSNSTTLGVPIPMSSFGLGQSVWPFNRDPTWFAAWVDMKSEPQFAINTVAGIFGTTFTGRSFEYRIAWTTLGINLANHMVFLTCAGIAFDLAKNDHSNGSSSRLAQYFWNGDGNDFRYTNKWGTLQLTLNSDTTEYLTSKAVVTVNGLSRGGTINGTNLICYNSSSNLTLSGYLGNIVWKSAPSALGPWTTLVGTNPTVNTGNLTASTYFQATVTQPYCSSSLSNIFLVTVDGLTVQGIIQGDNIPKCFNGVSNLTLTGQNGLVTNWLRSIDNTSFTSITGATTPLFSVNNLTNLGLNYFRVVVKNGVCPALTTTSYVITVTSPSITGASLFHNTNCGITDGSVTLTGVGSILPVQYTIFGPGSWQASGIFNNVPANTYSPQIRVLANPTCSALGANFTITIPGYPSISGVSVSHITNCGLTDGAVTISGAAGTGPLQYRVDGGTWQLSNVFTGLTVGAHTPYVRNQFSTSCTAAGAVFNITIPGVPTITGRNVTHITNCGLINGSVTINSTGGTGTLEYSINGSFWQSSNVFSGLNVGTYMPYVRNQSSIACSSSGVAFTTTIPGVPSISGTSLRHISGCGLSDGAITITGVGGGVSPFEYKVDGLAFQATNIFTNLGTGGHVVYVRNSTSVACSSSGLAFNITAPGVPSISGSNVTAVTNCGLSDGRVTITGVSGNPPYEYSLNGTTWQTSNIFTGLATNTYVPFIRNQFSPLCTANGTFFTINLPPNPTVTGVSVPACSDIYTVLTASGAAIYTWSPSPIAFTGRLATVNPSFNTIYTITGIDAQNCTSTGTVLVNVTAAPIAGAISGASNICTNGSTSLSLNGSSGTVQWQRSTNGGATWTDISGATSTVLGSTGALLSTTDFRVLVSKGAVCNLATTTSAVVTVANCSISASINANTSLVCLSSSTVSFSGIGLTVGTITGYIWDFGIGASPAILNVNTNQSTSGIHMVTYASSGAKTISLTVTGAGGERATATFGVQVDEVSQAGTVNVLGNNPVCYNTSTGVNLSSAVGTIKWLESTDGLSYTTIPGAVSMSYSNPNIIQNLYYKAEVVNGVCPVTTSGVAVVSVIGQSIGGTAGYVHDGCIGTNATITVGGFVGTIMDWEYSTPSNASYSSLGLNATSINRTITQNSEYYRAIVVNGTGCFPAYAEVQLNSIPCGVIASFSGWGVSQCISQSSAVGLNFTDLSQLASQGPIYQWQWDFDGGVPSISATSSIPGTVFWDTPGVKNITLTVRGAGSTQDSYTRSITIDDDANPGNYTITGNNNICLGQSITFLTSYERATSYVWLVSSNSNFVAYSTLAGINTYTETPGTSGVYYYKLLVRNNSCNTLTGSNGFNGGDTFIQVNVTQQPTTSFSYNGSKIYCKGAPSVVGPFVMTPGPAFGNVSAFTSNTLGSSLNSSDGSITLTNANPGIHTITYEVPAIGGCQPFSTSDIITITSQVVPSFVYPTSIVCQGFSTILGVTLSPVNVQGTFSALPAGLSIDGVTGSIVPKSSIPNTNGYTISYTPIVEAGCSNTPINLASTFVVRPTPVVSAFNYASLGTFCGVATTTGFPIPSNPSTNGIFSSLDSRLSINSLTGVINPNASYKTPNSYSFYRVDYTVKEAFCDAVISSSGITINDNPVEPGLSYNSTPYCSNDIIVPRSLLKTNAIFSVTTNGVTINQSGSISLPRTFNGVVNVKYGISNIYGCNPVASYYPVTIVSAPIQPYLDYGSRLFCNEGIVSPLTTTSIFSEGKFTVSNQEINKNYTPRIDSISGRIFLANSQTGKYQMKYKIDKGTVCPTLEDIYLFTITSSIGGSQEFDAPDEGVCVGTPIVLRVKNNLGSITGWQIFRASNTLAGYVLTDLFEPTSISGVWNVNLNVEDVYYVRSIIQNGSCSSVYSSQSKLIVYEDSKSGYATPKSSIVCDDEFSTEISLVGYKGAILWQSSLDSSYAQNIVWESLYDVPTGTIDTLITPVEDVYDTKKYYRALVKNGVCPAKYSNFVKINVCEFDPNIPNALTPTLNDQNSVWDLEKLRLKSYASIKIYNRYGVEVFSATGAQIKDQPWNGSGLPAGTYYYYIDPADNRQPQTGAVTIVK